MILEEFDVEFRRDGSVFDHSQVAALLSGLKQVSQLLVLCHGWNNNKEEAQELYRLFLDNLTRLQEEREDGSTPRVGVLKVFWPSKKFEDSDLIPGGGIASAGDENDDALRHALSYLQYDPDRLGGTGNNPIRTQSLDEAAALIPDLETSDTARRDFILRIRNVLNPDEAHPDDGSVDFFTEDTEDLFEDFSTPVPLAPVASAGGAASRTGGGTPFFGDLLSGFKTAARRLVNYATYYEMKVRAGAVGKIGLANVLLRVRAQYPALPIHMVGHSFGGRLVTAAASMFEPGDSRTTITLLQAAFSHNGLGKKYDGIKDGAFRRILDYPLISGPIIITHTKNDSAVGIAYPLASRFSGDDGAGFGTESDPYGGMGRNGAQNTPEVSYDETEVHENEVGRAYNFRPGKVYNLNADASIANHGDVANCSVVNVVLAAMATVDSDSSN